MFKDHCAINDAYEKFPIRQKPTVSFVDASADARSAHIPCETQPRTTQPTVAQLSSAHHASTQSPIKHKVVPLLLRTPRLV